MKKQQGFSLVEVIVSMSLMALTSFMLFKSMSYSHFLIRQTKQDLSQYFDDRNRKTERNCGFSLIELLVALFLSTYVISIAVTQFSTMSSQIHADIQALETIYDMVLVDSLIRKDVVHSQKVLGVINSQIWNADTHHYTHFQAINSDKNNLIITHIKKKLVLKALTASSDVIELNRMVRVKPNILISDGVHAELHRIRKLSSHQLTLDSPLKFNYPNNVSLYEWIEKTYFIKNQVLKLKIKHPEILSWNIQNLIISPSKSSTDSIELGFYNQFREKLWTIQVNTGAGLFC